MGNWAELPSDVLGLIVDQFSKIEDIAHFGAVCRPWRSVSVESWHFSIVDPWLMLAEKEDSDERGFYSLSTKKVYHLNLSEARGKKCYSSYGWLITLGLDLKLHLLNPFSRSRVSIQLPPPLGLPTQDKPGIDPEYFRRVFIHKVIFSSRPPKRFPCEDNEKFVVMGIFSDRRKLAFLRMGDEVWTHVCTPTGFHDIVYLNGQFYAFSNRGELVVVDISGPDPKTIEIAGLPDGRNNAGDFYLVESVGELFMLARSVYMGYVGNYEEGEEDEDEYFVHETDDFDVFKFNFDNMKWMQVKNLNNRAIFVGVNASFAIFPSNQSRCEPNCIYFTDDNPCALVKDGEIEGGAGKDTGVFRMGAERPHILYTCPDMLSHVCAPLWICPSL